MGKKKKYWIWPLYPLRDLQERVNMYVEFSDSKPGDVVQRIIQRIETSTPWIKKRIPTNPCDFAEECSYYVPTSKDFDIIKLYFPEIDPGDPQWARIEAELVGTDYTPSTLKGMTSPSLIALLNKVPRDNEDQPKGPKPDTFTLPQLMDVIGLRKGNEQRSLVMGRLCSRLSRFGKKARTKKFYKNHVLFKIEFLSHMISDGAFDENKEKKIRQHYQLED